MGDAGVGVAGDVPAGVGLGLVVVSTQGVQVVGGGLVGGSAVVVERGDVVQVAACRGLAAARECAGHVADQDAGGEVGAGPVGGGAAFDSDAGRRVGQDPAPGAVVGDLAGQGCGYRPVAGQLCPERREGA